MGNLFLEISIIYEKCQWSNKTKTPMCTYAVCQSNITNPLSITWKQTIMRMLMFILKEKWRYSRDSWDGICNSIWIKYYFFQDMCSYSRIDSNLSRTAVIRRQIFYKKLEKLDLYRYLPEIRIKSDSNRSPRSHNELWTQDLLIDVDNVNFVLEYSKSVVAWTSTPPFRKAPPK